MVGVDDFRNRDKGSHAKKADQQDAFEQLLRKNYGGGEHSKGAGGVDRDTGETYNKEKTKHSPGFLLVTETSALPDGSEDSNMSRALFYEVTEASTWAKDGYAAKAEGYSRSGLLNLVHPGYLRWVAGEIEKEGGLESWVASVKEISATFRKELITLNPTLNAKRRVYEIAGNGITGYRLFLDYLFRLDVMDSAEYERRLVEALEMFSAAMATCWFRFQGGSHKASALDLLVGAVGSGEYYIEGLTEPVGFTQRGRLGWVANLKGGENAIQVLPEMAEKITKMSGNALNVSLAPNLIRGENDRAFTRKISGKWGGSRAYTIRFDDWFGGKTMAEKLSSGLVVTETFAEDEVPQARVLDIWRNGGSTADDFAPDDVLDSWAYEAQAA